MDLEDVSPRGALIIALLALLPVAWFGLGRSFSAGVVTAINVLIIVTALYVAFTPISDEHGHGSSKA